MAGMRLMAGVDGREGGRDALALAKLLAQTVNATTIEVEAGKFGDGPPAEVLKEVAEAEQVDAIVLGSSHRGPVGRVLIGSVADELLHGAPCPVVVAPRGYASEPHEGLRRIGVAFDGTPEAKAALREAEALAAPARAEIEVLTVVAPPAAVPGVAGYVPVDPPDADRILTDGVNSIADELAARGRRLDGPPGTTLAEACEDGIDLLVAGSRRYGPAMRVLLGSVSTQLIHRAPCPVLVVPRP